jgi:hypothetical protein
MSGPVAQSGLEVELRTPTTKKITRGHWGTQSKPRISDLLAIFFVVGSPRWARTTDNTINSPVLYRLSYQGTTGPTIQQNFKK